MTTGASSISSTDIRSDYMLLLVTQLQNQNPLEPMDNNQMATQLAQLSQLEQMENMSTTFQKVLLSQQRQQATDLIGKEVSFFPQDSDTAQTGRVESVTVTDGQVTLKVGSFDVDMSRIQEIRN